jgi:hypothetical protein
MCYELGSKASNTDEQAGRQVAPQRGGDDPPQEIKKMGVITQYGRR